jgi:membrane protein DedA with SNARE-associated domain/rhodanese-related sulfurtransferase
VSQTIDFLVRHGAIVLFAAVFVEQIGIPLPAIPWLLAVGALSATGKFSASLAIALVLVACLVADGFWFYLGRTRGNRVLGFLCRISLEPDSCVRRTQNMFTRYGLRSLLIAKFLPGFLSTVAPPLAGMSGMKFRRFVLFDATGSLLYAICFVLLGYCFAGQIEQIVQAISSVGGSAVAFGAVLVAGYLGVKYWQRQRLLREFRMARITVSDLRQKQQAGESLTILDLRAQAALVEDPATIPGAVHATLDDIKSGNHHFPRDREIIVYCSCPNEASAARVALLLQKSGFKNVRPLLGGIDAWRQQNYPVQRTRDREEPVVVTAQLSATDVRLVTSGGSGSVEVRPSSEVKEISRQE